MTHGQRWVPRLWSQDAVDAMYPDGEVSGSARALTHCDSVACDTAGRDKRETVTDIGKKDTVQEKKLTH